MEFKSKLKQYITIQISLTFHEITLSLLQKKNWILYCVF